MEVLARAVDLLVGLLLLAGRAVAGELGEVGEGGQHLELAGEQRRVVAVGLAAGVRTRRRAAVPSLRVDVVAE